MPMKVALLNTALPPYRVHFFNQVHQHLGDGFCVFDFEDDSRQYRFHHRNDGSIVLRRSRKSRLGFDEAYVVKVPLGAYARLRQWNPDIVISQNFGVRSLIASLYCHRFSKPLVLWVPMTKYSESGRSRLRKAFRMILLRSADGVIVNCDSGAEYIRSLGGLCPIARVPYVTRNEPFLKIGVERAASIRYRFLTVGQLIPRKGLIEAIRALSVWLERCPEKNIEWTIVGDGPLKEVLKSHAAHPRLRLTIKDAVGYEDLPGVYATHGIFFFPTLCDEWGVVVNEAMASGLPVLGSIRSGAVNFFRIADDCGWTYDPLGLQDELFRALDQIFRGDAARVRILAECSRRKAVRLDIDSIACGYVKFLGQVCGGT